MRALLVFVRTIPLRVFGGMSSGMYAMGKKMHKVYILRCVHKKTFLIHVADDFNVWIGQINYQFVQLVLLAKKCSGHLPFHYSLPKHSLYFIFSPTKKLHYSHRQNSQ